MPAILQPALRRVLGGETRARVLGLLADAAVSKTGYELAKAARASPSKVYRILRDLADAVGHALGLGVRLDRLRPERFVPRPSRLKRERLPNYREFERLPEKDRALRRVARVDPSD